MLYNLPGPVPAAPAVVVRRVGVAGNFTPIPKGLHMTNNTWLRRLTAAALLLVCSVGLLTLTGCEGSIDEDGANAEIGDTDSID